MNEVTLRNESLGLSMTKATINGTDVVLAENVREALEWDSVPHMVRELKDGKEVMKIRVSDLKSEGWNFAKFGKVKKNTLYVYFLTRQGVARLIALFCCNFFLIFYENYLKIMQSGTCYICPTWCVCTSCGD